MTPKNPTFVRCFPVKEKKKITRKWQKIQEDEHARTIQATWVLPFCRLPKGVLTHRVRDAALKPSPGTNGTYVSIQFWCGVGTYLPLLSAEAASPLCPTCEGRAAGAGQVL